MNPVTDKQREVLNALGTYTNPPTARQLADLLETRRHRSATWTYKETHGVLQRLYRRGLVDRLNFGSALRWEINSAGLEARDG